MASGTMVRVGGTGGAVAHSLLPARGERELMRTHVTALAGAAL
ncbi:MULTISPECIES: hypothetical protein [unclassified Streptomyces]|nr:hypothetical protein [Streptomyces sp. 3211]